jgi:hypothetical protein
MNSEIRHPGWRIAGLPLICVFLAVCARAQIGRIPAECSMQWGAPVSGQVNTNGYGTLRFTAEGLTIEIEFVGGRAQRAAYRASAWDDKAIARVLGMNSDGQEWNHYVQPGQGAGDEDRCAWSRGEDSAMAELADNGLTVTGSGWYRHLAEPPPPEMASGLAESDAASVTNAVPLPPPREPIAGIWRFDENGRPRVALHVADNGELSWIVLGETERRVLDLTWKREAGVEKPTYTLTSRHADTATKDQPRPVGQLEITSTNRLEWRQGTGPGMKRDVPVWWAMKNGMSFERRDAIPRWKPRAPAALPAKGDAREDAVRLLGKPTGTMSAGGREVLVYPWGNVWIANGVVVGTE